MKGGTKLREWLKQAREQSGLTQKELAQSVDVTRPAYKEQ
ncbi:helix-turn-helix domain-containing protein [Lacticaseibacillus pabuli]